MISTVSVLREAAVDEDRAVRRATHRAQAMLATIVRYHTGQQLSDADRHARLSDDLMIRDPRLVRRIFWDCAVELGLGDRLSVLVEGRQPRFDTTSDIVEFLVREIFRRRNEQPTSNFDIERHTSLWTGPGDSVDEPAVEAGFPMPVEFCEGTPAEMGAQYGRSQAANLYRYIVNNVERIGLEKLKVMSELQDCIIDPGIYFTQAEIEEIQAMATAADIPWEFVLGHNIGLYPAYVPGCSQFAVSAERNAEFGLVHAVNEDSPYSLLMREHLTRVMTVRRPKGGVPYVTFGLVGTVGGLNGVNAAGLIVSTTLVMDRPRRRETEHGIIQPILTRKILEAATTIPEAIEVIRSLNRDGSWSICLSHFPTDRICYVEYDGESLRINDHQPTVVSTNHAMLHETMTGPTPHSVSRMSRLHAMLNLESNRGVSPSWAKNILRDGYDTSRGRVTPFPTMHTIRRVDNQGSFVIVPATGELWATAGPMAPTMADRYFRISLRRLFGESPATSRA